MGALSLAALSLAGVSLASAQPAPVGSELQVNTHTTGDQGYASAGMSASGDFVIVWQSEGEDGDGSGIFGRLFASTGAPLGPEFQVNSYTTGAQRAPSVAMTPRGEFVVVWQSAGQDGDSLGVFGRRYDGAGAPLGAEFQANVFTTDDQLLPRVAIDDAGDFTVVWQSYGQDGSASGIFGRSFASGGSPLGAEFQVNTYTTDNQVTPAIAMNAAGDLVVAWESNAEDGLASGIVARRFAPAGVATGAAFPVNSFTTGSQFAPSAAVGAGGAFVIAWTSYPADGSLDGVAARLFDSNGAPAGPDFEVNSFTTGSQYAPSVRLDPFGAFTVVWTSFGQDGSGGGVFGRGFDAAGQMLGTEFQVNSFTTDYQTQPTLAMSPSGGFVVAWQSFVQDGSSFGVFAQPFACADADADGLCDADEIVVTSPSSGATVDCADPKNLQPLIAWSPGSFDRFRVYLGTDSAFGKGTFVTSGSTLLKVDAYTPPPKKWASACRKALAADPNNPEIFVRVFGVDAQAGKKDPNRKAFSDVVGAVGGF